MRGVPSASLHFHSLVLLSLASTARLAAVQRTAPIIHHRLAAAAPQMIFAVFMDRGDSLLVEEYAYPVVTGAASNA